MIKRIIYILSLLLANLQFVYAENGLCQYVDPRIGSEGLGRVFIGPSAPFGMIKPGPDCTEHNNAGWAAMPEQVNGFSQTHVSGTGGGPKYGNILVQPFSDTWTISKPQYRKEDTIKLGYYETTFTNGINTRITTSDRASCYQFSYPENMKASLLIDAGFFLGESPVPDAREAQQFVGSEIEIVSTKEIRGYTRIRGGWNNGKAYTVYFYAISDVPFSKTATWKNDKISNAKSQYDNGEKSGAIVDFIDGTKKVNLKIGISFLSSLKAKANIEHEIANKSFEEVLNELQNKWEKILSTVQLSESECVKNKRMFYTALYHTMIMPVDRTGECPGWNDKQPYYDDYYAIWDTYRTSTPLITLLQPEREVDIVNSLLTICKRDGFMPDARSGNSNGRTQGGSNAEIMIADAMAKGMQGIDYEAALQAMIKDATVAPGGNEEAEGRGALQEYLENGFIPYGKPRAGTRTIEYAFCDWTIAQVAKGLGKNEVYKKYMKQSENWRNLWRADYKHDGVSGFIMPRDKDGNWLNQLPYGHSNIQKPTFPYPPSTSYEGPWYVAWWDCFFYEASSWEYSLSIPHDVKGLIELCGGANEFVKRLNTFFAHGYYNLSNEPSFLSPCLYHYVGMPETSSLRVLNIIDSNYKDDTYGIPGNDDSGAMSSWLAFHMMGLYPNAGHDYYLIHTPILKEASINVGSGRTFTIVAHNLSSKNKFIRSAILNGKNYDISTIDHATIIQGGTLTLEMSSKPGDWGRQMFKNEENVVATKSEMIKQNGVPTLSCQVPLTMVFTYSLHGQTRRFKVGVERISKGDVQMSWTIERHGKLWRGNYFMEKEALNNARCLNYEQPIDGLEYNIPSTQLFAIISSSALRELKENGHMNFNGTIFKLVGREINDDKINLIHVIDINEGAEMWIEDNEDLPLIWQMKNNPVEIDWKVNLIK